MTISSYSRVQKSLPQLVPESGQVPEVPLDDNSIGQMLEELKEIISKKAEKEVAEIHFKKFNETPKEETKTSKPKRKKKKEGLTLHPRGGAPSARFVLPTQETSPKLEFGFKPITTQSFVSSTSPAPFRFSLHEADQVRLRESGLIQTNGFQNGQSV